MVDPSLSKLNKKVKLLNVPIHHYQEDKGLDKVDGKQKYYMSLLIKNVNDFPDEAINYNHLAVMYNTYENNAQKAIGLVEKAIKLKPKNIDYRLHLSTLFNKVGDYEKEIDCLKQAIKIKQDERLYRALGFSYYKLGKYNNSLDSFKKALELNTPAKKEVIGYIDHVKEKIGESFTVTY
jgi:tetratricopeptide (TPR) repeat protein